MDERVKKLIKDAFDGEAKAIVSYHIFAEIARQEGRADASELFLRMAKNEIEHAKIWYKYLFDDVSDTSQNLMTAAKNENAEWKRMYPEFAARAREYGSPEVADKFERVASIECEHERRFVEEEMQSRGEQTEKFDFVEYSCLFCGYPSTCEQDVCPVCMATNSFIAK